MSAPTLPERIRAYIARVGILRAVEQLGMHQITILRLGCGVPVTAPTAHYISTRLAELEATTAPPAPAEQKLVLVTRRRRGEAEAVIREGR